MPKKLIQLKNIVSPLGLYSANFVAIT